MHSHAPGWHERCHSNRTVRNAPDVVSVRGAALRTDGHGTGAAGETSSRTLGAVIVFRPVPGLPTTGCSSSSIAIWYVRPRLVMMRRS